MEVRVCLENSFTQVIIDDFGLYHGSKNRSFILWRRKWEKGRGTVLVFDPKIGPLDNIYVNFQNSWMLSGTLDRGMHCYSQHSTLLHLHIHVYFDDEIAMATKSDPSTGKTERSAMFGHEDAEPSPVSSMKMDGHQIIWGHYDGYITITTRTISTSGRQLKRFIDIHEGPVTALTTSSTLHNVVLSGGQDGIVKIWDIASGRCVGNLLGK
jgi:WD40 repeat protein